MANFIDSVKLDELLPGVIVVQDMNGAQIRYLLKDGILYPGRPWRATAPDGHRVTLVLQFPDGTPEVIKIDDCPDGDKDKSGG
jgi:hypothetical protein